MFIARTLVTILLLACAGGSVQERRPGPVAPDRDLNTDAVYRGQLLAAQACAGCHAIGDAGLSPMGDATPFREIVQRYPLDQLEEGFAEGLVTTHPAMPQFIFRASEIDDLIAYLESVKATQ